MKIALLSDVHLEFGEFTNFKPNADVLVLAGDCLEAIAFKKQAGPRFEMIPVYTKFLQTASDNYQNVIFVMGNHEHYGGYFDQTADILNQEFSKYGNIHLLEKDTLTINDVKFIGGTMWTDCNGHCPITEFTVSQYMADYKMIQLKDETRKLRVIDTVRDHEKFVNYIPHVISNTAPDKKIVVVTHHAPSRLSVDPRFQNDHYSNGGFVNDLDFMIEDLERINLWIHGHIHTAVDYTIGRTRVVSNPRGYYGLETLNDQFEPKVIEL